MKVTVNNAQIIINKAELMSKHANLVTVTKNTLTTKNTKIIFPDSVQLIEGIQSLTLKISDYIQVLCKTDKCTINKTHILVEYFESEIAIEKKYRRINEIISIPNLEPDFSIRLQSLQILSDDDFMIKCTSDGTFLMTSNYIIETSVKYTNCKTVYKNITEKTVRVKNKDLRIVNDFMGEKVFCFFPDTLIVYIYESEMANMVIIPLLV